MILTSTSDYRGMLDTVVGHAARDVPVLPFSLDGASWGFSLDGLASSASTDKCDFSSMDSDMARRKRAGTESPSLSSEEYQVKS